MLLSDDLLHIVREEERRKLLNEGYIHKSECQKAKEERKIHELKKINKSLQRKITELTLQIETDKMMRQ